MLLVKDFVCSQGSEFISKNEGILSEPNGLYIGWTGHGTLWAAKLVASGPVLNVIVTKVWYHLDRLKTGAQVACQMTVSYDMYRLFWQQYHALCHNYPTWQTVSSGLSVDVGSICGLNCH